MSFPLWPDESDLESVVRKWFNNCRRCPKIALSPAGRWKRAVIDNGPCIEGPMPSTVFGSVLKGRAWFPWAPIRVSRIKRNRCEMEVVELPIISSGRSHHSRPGTGKPLA